MKNIKIAILGAGNIGSAIAGGILKSGIVKQENIFLTSKNPEHLRNFKRSKINICQTNNKAVASADIIIICVQPRQMDDILKEIKSSIDPKKHIIASVVTGVKIEFIKKILGKSVPVIRVMPNTAIAVQESMTCICGKEKKEIAEKIKSIFDLLGYTLIIPEDKMNAATVLCACGIAFFMRAIRAASQGGIEIGFHPYEALPMAAQTAKGAARLLQLMKDHPESEIDRVTTPLGCTITGLNEMEHAGFSSAMIKGIIASSVKAEQI